MHLSQCISHNREERLSCFWKIGLNLEKAQKIQYMGKLRRKKSESENTFLENTFCSGHSPHDSKKTQPYVTPDSDKTQSYVTLDSDKTQPYVTPNSQKWDNTFQICAPLSYVRFSERNHTSHQSISHNVLRSVSMLSIGLVDLFSMLRVICCSRLELNS